jgi:alkylation response protein AidB-like acyl-CoA dehydrogenase
MQQTIDDLAARWRAQPPSEEFPAGRIDDLRAAGLLAAFRSVAPGVETTGFVRVLRRIGAADLSLGRLYEGHVNAVQLVHAYGSDGQRARLSHDLAAGCLMGVWNTEPSPGMTVAPAGGDGATLTGAKVFASGAGRLDRVLITARDGEGAKRMILADVAGMTERADNRGWAVRGMRGTVSGRFDFSGMTVPADALIGQAGDYEREPRFSAGAWRFAAVQLGAVEALLRALRDHLVTTGKGDDPVQRLRFGQCVAATRSAGLWVEQAAQLAQAEAADAIPVVLMTRGIVEEAGLATMEAAARGVGTASFFDGDPIDRITRDLGLYLRQPVPDQARDRAAAAWLEADRWGTEPWW